MTKVRGFNARWEIPWDCYRNPQKPIKSAMWWKTPPNRIESNRFDTQTQMPELNTIRRRELCLIWLDRAVCDDILSFISDMITNDECDSRFGMIKTVTCVRDRYLFFRRVLSVMNQNQTLVKKKLISGEIVKCWGQKQASLLSDLLLTKCNLLPSIGTFSPLLFITTHNVMQKTTTKHISSNNSIDAENLP